MSRKDILQSFVSVSDDRLPGKFVSHGEIPLGYTSISGGNFVVFNGSAWQHVTLAMSQRNITVSQLAPELENQISEIAKKFSLPTSTNIDGCSFVLSDGNEFTLKQLLDQIDVT